MITIHVIKRDGTAVPYDGYEIVRSIESAARGLDDSMARAVQIQSELEIILFDRMTTEQLDEAVIHIALQNVKEDPAFDTIAARLAVKSLYKRVFGATDDLFGDGSLETIILLHRNRFESYVQSGIAAGLLDARLGSAFRLDDLAAALDPRRDDLLHYIGVATMRTRYLLTSAPNGTGARHPIEAPQFFWMRVAMGLALNEDDPTVAAIDFYHRMSRLEYLAAGSTLVNAGTAYPQLSNCFVMQTEDDIEHIAKSVRDVMWLTKGTGGIGLSMTKLRSEGSPIHSNNTASTGPIPFMHTIDSTLRAISRGGKKFGALCFYMENWHLDFAQFLDLRQNSGDPYRRTRTANTAVWISDEFMKRVRDDVAWYLFDPLDTPDLVELYGADFSARYAEYVALAEAGAMPRFTKLHAREQFHAILVSLQSTSHPWLTWKDTINTRALNNNTGTIHLSNLCTEICLPQDRHNVAVCNLASINLSRHLCGAGADAVMDWERLRDSTRAAVRQLDNLIDVTVSSVPESQASNVANRAIGLGVMGYTDIVERCGHAYDSEPAYDLIDEVMEFVSYHAIDASADLARDRGAYPNFAGSRWSRGLVPIDTLDALAQDRDVAVEVPRTMRLDWDVLRAKVAGGVRNATLLAIAPTASIGLVAGTTPGLDPRFAQIFSRATSAGKFLEVNPNLVADLKALNLWDEVKDDLLAAQGDVSCIDAIPGHLKEIYRTSFQLSPYAFINVAARAQKWIDQAISRNIYLSDRSVLGMADLYMKAWEMGVKTTYYLHMMPRHTAEQSTVRVNKAEKIRPSDAVDTASRPGRRGFGFGGATARREHPSATTTAVGASHLVGGHEPVEGAPTVAVGALLESSVSIDVDLVAGTACPTDPQELLQCESCQ